MRITMHICRGNFRSTWISEGGYEPVAETLFGSVGVDGFFLEYDTERAGGFEPLRFVKPGPQRIVLGLVTSKSGVLEKPDDIRRRIDEAARYVAMDQLCLSPQCGFASTEEGDPHRTQRSTAISSPVDQARDAAQQSVLGAGAHGLLVSRPRNGRGLWPESLTRLDQYVVQNARLDCSLGQPHLTPLSGPRGLKEIRPPGSSCRISPAPDRSWSGTCGCSAHWRRRAGRTRCIPPCRRR